MLDVELVASVRASMDEAAAAELTREAAGELASFRERMSADAFARAVNGAFTRLVRERFNLPTVAFT